MPDSEHTDSPIRYQIHHPHVGGLGHRLSVENMDRLFGWKPYTEFPESWSVERGRPGIWRMEKIEDDDPSGEGCVSHLVSIAAANAGPTLLWYEPWIPGNHALYARVLLKTKNSEFVMYWNGDGHSSRQNEPWSLTLGGIAGWRAGYTGLEYLRSEAGGPSHQVRGTALSKSAEIEAGREYDIFVGTFGDVDFCFVNPATDKGERTLAAQFNTPRGMLGLDSFHKKQACVAIGHSATHRKEHSEISVRDLAVFQIPNKAAEPWGNSDKELDTRSAASFRTGKSSGFD